MDLHRLDRMEPTPLRTEIVRRATASEPLRPIPSPNLAWRRIVAGAVAFAVFALAAAFGTGVLTHHRGAQPRSTAWSGYAEGWTELAPPPAWRDGAAVLWTGSQLLYWGGTPRGSDGSHPQADGFIFDPGAGTWTTMPAAPLAGVDPRAFWTGDEAIFVLTSDAGSHAEAFDPSADSWRRLPDGPAIPDGASSAWTGSDIVLFGGGSSGAPSNQQAWALDPVGEWRRLADAPVGMNLSDAVWTGTDVVVVGSAVDRMHVASTATAQAEAYDPASDRWSQLPPPPISAQTASVAYVDQHLVAWELYGPDSAEWLPDEQRWRSLEMGGFEGGECYAAGVAVAAAMFTWNCGSPTAWYAATGAWVSVGAPTGDPSGFMYGFGSASSAGDAAIVEQIDTIIAHNGDPYIGSPDAPEHLWVWKPPADAPTSSWEPTITDARDLVGGFLSDWDPGSEPFLDAKATSDVVDRCASGAGGLLALRDGAVDGWHFVDERRSNGAFVFTIELMRDGVTAATEIFTVGAGTTADGRAGQLVITDVRRA